MRRSDWQTLALLGGLTVCFAGMLTRGLWMLLPVACILCVSACAAKHNHTHCPTFCYRWLNRMMDLWLTVLTGTSTSSAGSSLPPIQNPPGPACVATVWKIT